MSDIDDGEFEALKNEAGLGDISEGGRRLNIAEDLGLGRHLSVQDEVSTLLFGDANTLAL